METERDIPRKTTIVETVLPVKLDHQSLLQVGRALSHDLGIGVLEDVVPAHLDVTLSGHDAQGWLGAEVDQLPSEVPLVLRHALIQRRRQARIIPGGGLGVVVDKVHAGRVGQAHLPAAGQRAQLRDGLLLDRRVVVGAGILAVHADVLLSARIDPGGGAGVVIDEIRPAFGGRPLLPPGRELPSACRGRSCGHHGHRVGAATRRRGRGLRGLILQIRRTGARAVLRQHPTLVRPPLQLHVGLALRSLRVFVVVRRRAGPRGGSRVVVDVIGPAQVVLPSLPSGRQTALTVFERAEVGPGAMLVVGGRRRPVDGDDRTGRSGGRGHALGVRRRIRDGGRGVRMTGRVRGVHLRNQTGGGGRRVVGAMHPVRLVGGGAREVGGQVNDEFSMDDQIIVGFLQVSGEHFCRE